MEPNIRNAIILIIGAIIIIVGTIALIKIPKNIKQSNQNHPAPSFQESPLTQ